MPVSSGNSIICTTCDACQSSGAIYLLSDLERCYGEQTTEQLRRRFRCSRCGVKGKVAFTCLPDSREYVGVRARVTRLVDE